MKSNETRAEQERIDRWSPCTTKMSALTRPVLRFSIPFHRSVLKVRGTKIDLFFFLKMFFFLFLLFLKIHKKLKVRYIVAQYKKNVCRSPQEESLFEKVSRSLSSPFLWLHSSTLSWVAGAFSPSVERVVDEIKGSVLCDLVSLGQPLHEVDFPLVLPGFGALAGSAFACEGHVPAFILHIL